MKFSDYQSETRKTVSYPDAGDTFVFPTLGLVGESGEVAEKIKKLLRDTNVRKPSEVDDATRGEIMKELGDVLWYVAQLATEFGVGLDTVAELNLEKIKDRLERSQISGSGDNR